MVAPVRERGLKFRLRADLIIYHIVAPVRERGLKLKSASSAGIIPAGRSREGAWIEIG